MKRGRESENGVDGRKRDLTARADQLVGFAVGIERDASAACFQLSGDSSPVVFRHFTFPSACGGPELQTGIEEQVMAWLCEII